MLLSALILAIYDMKKDFTNKETRNRLGWVIVGSNLALTLFITILSIFNLF